MSRVRSSREVIEQPGQQSDRLPLRWAVILLAAGVVAVPMAATVGAAGAVAAFVTIAGALHVIVG
ncbi:hypothetical protein [Actinoplanes sp. NPDC026670]|uniref:hypothetical protein n=1 Tax=Actinoplanes sp. NPDC026670 TaxID=3154700 RepID=UPI0033C5BC1D